MATQRNHAKIALSKNDAGTVRYCESCDVLEMDLGTMSVRLDSAMFDALSMLLSEAVKQLSLYKRNNPAVMEGNTYENIFH